MSIDCVITNYRMNRDGEQIADVVATDGTVYGQLSEVCLAKITASPD